MNKNTLLLSAALLLIVGCKTMPTEDMVGKQIRITCAHETLNMTGDPHAVTFIENDKSDKIIIQGKLIRITDDEVVFGWFDETQTTNAFGYGGMGKDLILLPSEKTLSVKFDEIQKIELINE